MEKVLHSHFINRGLSWLEFNQRVLDQALDKENPLLERLKFLCIVSSNLDEFFEVRVAGLKQQVQTNTVALAPDGMSPKSELAAISKRARKQVDDQYRCWNEEIEPGLAAENIKFHNFPDVPESEHAHFEKFFHERIFPVLTPLAIDPSHPFPQLLNKSLNIIVHLEGEGINTDLAVVQVPRILPRVVPFSQQTEEQGHDFVFLGSIINHYVGTLFHGVKVLGAHLFRVTRNSNLYIDEEEAENLLHAIEEELRHVNRGAAVRLEVQDDCPDAVANRLLEIFNLGHGDLYRHEGPINLTRLMPLALSIDRPDLRDKRFTPATVVSLNEEADIFWHIRKGDILMQHPYDSFQTVLDFLGQAAEDPHVLAIKQTLYRTSSDSPLVASLIHAAENGKQVTVIIELKARFDEAANIKWARLMREAGVNVIYGIAGLKTHAKAMLVVRQEGEIIRRYAHLGTGNYHPSTARLYTDLGLLTAREDLTSDVAAMFNILTGVSKFPGMKELLMAPYDLREGMLELIDLDSYRIDKQKPGSLPLPDDDATLDPAPVSGGGFKSEPELNPLSAILTNFNEQHGTNFSDEDRIHRLIREEIAPQVARDQRYRNARANTPNTAAIELQAALNRAIGPLFLDQTEFYKQFKDNPQFRNFVQEYVERLLDNNTSESA
jgi:polyphosphate kinase